MLGQIHMLKSGTSQTQRQMQIVIDNIANVSSPGFKRHRVEMESLFPNALASVLAEFQDPKVSLDKKRRFYLEFGQAVRMSEVEAEMKQGSFEFTNRRLDVAIEGKGFFQFRMPDGSLSYARAGNLNMDSEGNLTDTHGHPLEPAIQIPKNVTDISITQDGKVKAHFQDQPIPREVGEIQLAVFGNVKQLKSIGQNLYVQTDSSGEASIRSAGTPEAGVIRQGALELSNVNLVEEMMSMLMTQRTFEINVAGINSVSEMVKYSLDIPK